MTQTGALAILIFLQTIFLAQAQETLVFSTFAPSPMVSICEKVIVAAYQVTLRNG